jgi:16S rRNA G966 N2-methylase RsmD
VAARPCTPIVMTRHRWAPLQSLPPYLGGKRQLLPAIFAAVDEVIPRERWSGLRFLDPFSGGGAVSLYAKGHGFSVHSNDIAARGYIVGKALIENGETRLGKLNLLPLFEGVVDAELQETALEFLNERQATFIGRAIPAAERGSDATCWLLLLVIVKWLLRALPMSSPAATDAARAAALDLDSISSRRIGTFLRGQGSVGPDTLWRIARQVNAGVLPGTGEASQLDARDFLHQHDGDVVYLDPPYPGTTSYEREYRSRGSRRRWASRSATSRLSNREQDDEHSGLPHSRMLRTVGGVC